jgi:hypothetical protein
MATEPNPAIKRSPVFGKLSLAAPFIGGILIFILLKLPDMGFILGLYMIPLTPICGVGFAVAGCVRREQHWFLPWIGLLFNLAILLLLWVERDNIIGSPG